MRLFFGKIGLIRIAWKKNTKYKIEKAVFGRRRRGLVTRRLAGSFLYFFFFSYEAGIYNRIYLYRTRRGRKLCEYILYVFYAYCSYSVSGWRGPS